jgi:hypothetical protein
LGFAMPPVFALKASRQQDNFFSLKLQRSGWIILIFLSKGHLLLPTTSGAKLGGRIDYYIFLEMQVGPVQSLMNEAMTNKNWIIILFYQLEINKSIFINSSINKKKSLST